MACIGVCLLFLPLVVMAHLPNQSYVYLRIYEDVVRGHIDITSKDLKTATGIDIPEGFTAEDLKPYLPQIQEYILQHTSISSEKGLHKIAFKEPTVLALDFGEYIQLHFDLENSTPIPKALDITYDVLLDKEPSFLNMVLIEYHWKAGIYNNEASPSLLLTRGDASQSLEIEEYSVMNGFWAMIKMGVWHIWIGLDHILFLLALLLPSVVRRIRSASQDNPPPAAALGFAAGTLPLPASMNIWTPVERFRPALIYVLKIISLFTVAHTITLSLAALQIVDLPSRLVESIIAFSIALAAYNNIRPIFKNEWIIAFGFGLFHGFGFASVLGEIGLSGEFMTLSLLGFNIGVEIGQVVIICAIFPILYFLRNSSAYPKILFYGSLFLIAVSLFWVVERVFDIDLLLDNYVFKALRMAMEFVGL